MFYHPSCSWKVFFHTCTLEKTGNFLLRKCNDFICGISPTLGPWDSFSADWFLDCFSFSLATFLVNNIFFLLFPYYKAWILFWIFSILFLLHHLFHYFVILHVLWYFVIYHWYLKYEPMVIPTVLTFCLQFFGNLAQVYETGNIFM